MDDRPTDDRLQNALANKILGGTMEKLSDVPGGLWDISTKVRGLSEVLNMAKGEPPFSEEGLMGFSYLLGGIADEIDQIKHLIEYIKLPIEEQKHD